MKIVNVKPHKPYKWQKHCLENLNKLNVIVAPRQHGKTYLVTQIIATTAFSKPNAQIVMLCDTVKRIYKLYKDEFDTMFGWNKAYKWTNDEQSHIEIELPCGGKSTILLYGTTNQPYSVKGTHPDLIVMDEAGLNHPRSLTEACMPATDKSGGIIIVTGTVEDNWYYDLWLKANKKIRQGSPHWFAFSFKFGDTWSKNVHDENARDLIVAKYDLDNLEEKQIFQKEYMCDWFASGSQAPYKKSVGQMYEMDRVGTVPVNPNVHVGLTWDNGLGCTAVWIWQVIHNVPRFVKYHEWREQSCQDIAKDINIWLNTYQTKVDCMVTPHTMNERMQSDPKLSSLTQIYKSLINFDGITVPIPKVGKIEYKELALNELLKVSVIDENNCGYGIRALSTYKRDMKKAEKDKFSHSVDAISEFALGWMRGKIPPSKGLNMSSEFWDGWLAQQKKNPNNDSVLKYY